MFDQPCHHRELHQPGVPRWLPVAIAVMMILLCGFTSAAETASTESTGMRPRIGVALSGGGARGAAHVGVLRVLEEMRIPIDYIAGTSMGSIIGGLYASGMTTYEIEHALKSIDWENIFSDAPPREDRSFRRKSDDKLYAVKAKPGFNDGELELPAGIIQGQKFNLALRELSLPVSTVTDFDQLHIPFRAVASDIGTGQPVVLGEGDLALAMRASMAVPGAFAPAEIDGHLLVDGGITNNLPISVVRDMGADIIIAIDISTPLQKPEDVRNVLQITEQLTGIMTRTNTEQQIASLTGRDVLIVPDLVDITSGDFERSDEAVPIGRAAAEAQRDQLARLSLPESEYQALLAARTARPDTALPIVHFVRIENDSALADGMIRERLQIQEGQPLDREQLEADIGTIYGLELFQNVGYNVVEENGQTGVVVRAKAREWGPNYLQFGLEMYNDSTGQNSYNLGMAYQKTGINHLGGEIRTGVQFGASPSIGGGWYQPLDHLSRWFIHPGVFFGRRDVNVFNGSGSKLAEYRVSEFEADLAAGREFSVYGEGRVGYRFRTGDIDLQVGQPLFQEGEYDTAQVYLRLSTDRLDDFEFPSKGGRATVEYATSREDIGSDTDFDQATIAGSRFLTYGQNTFGLAAAVNATVDGQAPVQNRYLGGGFLNLSGYAQDSLSGQQSALATVLYYRRYTPLPILSWYVGGSLEYGGVWEEREDIGSDAIAAGSLFVGADTPIGPLYVGYGLAENGNSAAFFYLGRPFN